jgi:hypothetical protein
MGHRYECRAPIDLSSIRKFQTTRSNLSFFLPYLALASTESFFLSFASAREKIYTFSLFIFWTFSICLLAFCSHDLDGGGAVHGCSNRSNKRYEFWLWVVRCSGFTLFRSEAIFTLMSLRSRRL